LLTIVAGVVGISGVSVSDVGVVGIGGIGGVVIGIGVEAVLVSWEKYSVALRSDPSIGIGTRKSRS